MKNDLRERIAVVLVECRNNKAELARVAGVSRSAVGQWLDGTVEKINAEAAFAIQDRFNFNARWLVHGTPPVKLGQEGQEESWSDRDRLRIYHLDEQEDKLLQHFRRMQPERRRALIEQILQVNKRRRSA